MFLWRPRRAGASARAWVIFERVWAAQKDADARNEAAGLGQPAGDFVVRKLREEASR